MNATEGSALSAAVGDVVVCRDPVYREGLKIPGTLGLVLEARKDRAKVYFDGVGEPWVPTEALARVKNPETGIGIPAWMQRAWFLARMLDALFMEVVQVAEEGCAFRVFHGAVDITRLDALRAGLGEELCYFTLQPAGMHKMESAIAIKPGERAAPPAPPPPTEPERPASES